MTPTLKDFQTGAMIKSIGVPNVSEKLTLAFTSKELNIASILTNSVGNEASSVCRFNMKATKPNGKPYYVEYVLFCKTCVNSGLVTEIVELLDTQ